jgi:hypothetical protein
MAFVCAGVMLRLVLGQDQEKNSGVKLHRFQAFKYIIADMAIPFRGTVECRCNVCFLPFAERQIIAELLPLLLANSENKPSLVSRSIWCGRLGDGTRAGVRALNGALAFWRASSMLEV